MNLRNLLLLGILAVSFGASLVGCGSGDAIDTDDAGKPTAVPSTAGGGTPNGEAKGGVAPPGI